MVSSELSTPPFISLATTSHLIMLETRVVQGLAIDLDWLGSYLLSVDWVYRKRMEQQRIDTVTVAQEQGGNDTMVL